MPHSFSIPHFIFTEPSVQKQEDVAVLTRKEKVRISESLSKGEQEATASRKEEVKKGLANLGIQCDEDKIPNIAVLGSGGGLRAMIALYGTLAELKKCNLLDCVMYLCGVSGSTWCMSSLYQNEDWAQKIEVLEKHQCEKLTSQNWEFIRAVNATREALKDECYSLTDFWSYFIVYSMLQELDESTLSEHRISCENGKNPYPIYAAVDKDTYEGHNPGSWFEFTPHEIGVPGIGEHPGIGAYIDTRHFGSFFQNGELVEEKKEKTICYLQGLWGSALGSKKEIKKVATGAVWDFLNHVKGRLPFCHSTYSDDLEQERLNEKLDEDVQEEVEAVPLLWDDSMTDTENLRMLIEAYQYVLELQQLALDDKTTVAEDVFDRLGNTWQNIGALRTTLTEAYQKVLDLQLLVLDDETTMTEDVFDCLENTLENIENLKTALTKAYQDVLELQLLALDDKTTVVEDVFDRLGNILQSYSSGKHYDSKSYELFRKLRHTWLSADAKTREEACTLLWEALDTDFEDARAKVSQHELASQGIEGGGGGGGGPYLKASVWDQFNARQPESIKLLYDLVKMAVKTHSCIAEWTWGTTNNFLNNCCDVKIADLREKNVVSLVDAGLALNSAYPLILHSKRNVKLILSFDFSAGNPFETIKKASEYCKVHGIKFPEIDESKLKNKDNPSNCYIFRGDDLTVMHFPLFNKGNCQETIAKHSDTYSIFKRPYSVEDIEEILTAAKKNIAEVQHMILKEIKHIIGLSP